jgi:hypothetical protein
VVDSDRGNEDNGNASVTLVSRVVFSA